MKKYFLLFLTLFVLLLFISAYYLKSRYVVLVIDRANRCHGGITTLAGPSYEYKIVSLEQVEKITSELRYKSTCFKKI